MSLPYHPDQKFRKKPVVILAWRLPEGTSFEPTEWLDEALREGVFWFTGDGARIKTLEGELHASPGDWIIKGVKGEIYPCKPDIFEATYEPVQERS